MDGNKERKKVKYVQVVYDWKPITCNHCKKFGHGILECKHRPRSQAEKKLEEDRKQKEELKENKETMEDVFVDYSNISPFYQIMRFGNVLGDEIGGGVISIKVNNDEMERMCKEVSEAEIKEALKSVNDNKAPGLMGLREGDPISHYLLTIVMEVLNLILLRKIRQTTQFKFHKGFDEMKIVSLCFADDLLVLCNGSVGSVGTIKQALDKFSEVLGQYPNMSKSTMFCGNISDGLKRDVLQVASFAVGSLPVRYLGVLLITQWPSLKDCKCLFDRVRDKSLWEVQVNPKASWGWRRLLELREIVRPHVYSCIDWKNKTKVADMMTEGQWRWQEGRMEQYLD
nr:RNA-directed DNA polymerase, eukaryota, reverse transcriptase zinc-binding domain protein [Tanacetum cinerariifolium]